MGFSEDLIHTAAPITEKVMRHPFITGIGDGSLAMEKFRYYMRQDYLYLVDYCRAISLAVAKAGSVEDMGWFASLIHATLNTEMSLHVSFCGDFGITEEELGNTEPSPTTLAYTRHLIETAYSGGVGEIASSLLPCMGGYSEIGQMLHARGLPTGQPLYARWIKTYSTPEFAEISVRLRSFIDRTAVSAGKDETKKMEEAFVVSSRYEYKFWDAAFRMEQWPV